MTDGKSNMSAAHAGRRAADFLLLFQLTGGKLLVSNFFSFEFAPLLA